jgi:hypothetical protein
LPAGPIAASGTLVVMVPSNDGLVVAAESRSTVGQKYCDTAFKIVEPARPPRTVITVTGNGIYYPDPGPGVPDLCAYISRAPRLLDIERVVREYLEKQNRDIGTLRMEEVAKQCVDAVKAFGMSWPGVLRAYSGREMFSVAMAAYNPASRTATVLNFVVRITAATLDPEAARIARKEFTGISPREDFEFGETDYLIQNVYRGAGRKFLDKETIAFFQAGKTVSQTSLQEAQAVAVNIIEAASRTTELVTPPNGIGGPIDVVLLGQGPRPRRLRWKKQ